MRALTVHDGRLYYSVDDGPEIWSVGLSDDGGFGSDVRSELVVKAEQPLPVSSLAFDAQGRMIVAQRGAQKGPFDYGQFAEGGKAQVLRYNLEVPDDPATPGLWSPTPEEYPVGFAEGQRLGAGSVAMGYAYKPDGGIDLATCGGTLAITGDDLRDNPTLANELAAGGPAAVTGVQIGGVDLVRPQNVPPKQSVFIDYDPRADDAGARGHTGNVAVFSRCNGGGAGFPPVADEGGAAPPVVDGGGGCTAPPVIDDGDGGTTAPPVVDDGGGGTTAPPVVDDARRHSAGTASNQKDGDLDRLQRDDALQFRNQGDEHDRAGGPRPDFDCRHVLGRRHAHRCQGYVRRRRPGSAFPRAVRR